jgi:CRP/FNR family cyclic AMP-dependent transcriptional regulator
MDPTDIRSIPLFAGLSPDEQTRVAAAAQPIHFEAGEVIVSEGEFSFDFYAITSGAAEVQHDGGHVADLGPGDVLGEMGVIPQESRGGSRRRSATVVVTAPMEAIAIAGGEFRRMTEDIPALRDALRALVSERAADH